MRYDDPTLRDVLAGQYVLGALQGRARARFERLLRSDTALRRLVHEWEDKLTPLAGQTAATEPPARVFAAIQRRIDGGTAAIPSLWERLGFWRTLSAAGAAAVIVLALSTTFLMLRPPATVSPTYMAVLENNAAQPVLVVTAYRGPWRLNLEPLTLPPLPADKVLQIWAVEKGTGVVRPLVAFTPGKPQQIAITEEHWKLIKGADTLVANVEPSGTTPMAPTTPVVYSGLCINLKGV